MLWTIAAVLIILWLLGLVSSTTMGGYIHALLVIAVVVILVNIIRRQRTLRRLRIDDGGLIWKKM